MKRSLKLGLGLVSILATGAGGLSCSTDSNINQFFVAGKHKEALDVLVAEAQYDYDQGKYDDAITKAEKAFEMNKNNEEVAVLLGYIYLSKAGIDPFQLAKTLIGSSSKSAALAGSENAASQLSSLSSIVGVTAAELVLLKSDAEVATPPAAFDGLPVIRPARASVGRLAGVSTLEFTDKAIKVVCPFVNREVLIEDDPRHTTDACPESENEQFFKPKSHFLWAFAHLADALSFYSLVLYSTQADGSPNIVERAEKISEPCAAADTSCLVTYVELVKVLTDDIDAVFQTSEPDSALNAVLNGLGAASLGFSQLPGIPSSVTDGIQAGLDSVKGATSGTSTSSGGFSGADPSVLKGQLTAGVTKELATKITELSSQDDFAENKTDICGAYASIAGGQGDTPAECK